MFGEYNTNSINILNVFSAEVHKSDIGRKIHQFGETQFCQIGIKFRGETQICYNGKCLDYRDNTVLYLPREKCGNIKYDKKYITEGQGVCIFFTSDFPMHDKQMLYRCDKTLLPYLFREILHSYNSNNSLETKSIFYKIIHELDNIESKSSDNTFKKTVTDYMNTVKKPDIYIEDIAALFDYSADHFRHKFRKEFNMPSQEFIIRKRIEIAQELLLNTELTVSEIAVMSGFSDSNYFSRIFKSKTGYTPSEFRNKLKKFL